MIYATMDIESTGLNRYTDRITFIGLGLTHSVDDKSFYKAWIFDMSIPEMVEKFLQIIKRLLRLGAKFIFQNGNFDTLFIEWKHGIKIPVSDDIMLMGTAYDLAAEHNLKKMAYNYLGIEDWDIATKDKTGKSKDFKKTLVPYLKKDVKNTWLLYRFFRGAMTEDQIKIYKKLLKPAYAMYKGVERRGIYFDREAYKGVKKKYQDIEDSKLRELKSHYDINWNSPQQKAYSLTLKVRGYQ